jgi:hypothetical protein
MDPRPLINDSWRRQKQKGGLSIFCLRLPLESGQRIKERYWVEGLDQVKSLRVVSLAGKSYRAPYDPFLRLVKEAFDGLDLLARMELFQNIQLYPTHRSVWRNYLFGETEERRDLIFLDQEEIIYEKKMFPKASKLFLPSSIGYNP